MKPKKKAKPRQFVAVCTAGCMHDGKPRQLEECELAAHEDKHLSSDVRVLVRMLRAAKPDVRKAVIAYVTQDKLRFAKKDGE